MSRSVPKSPAVSLFPFLAVLVCTMGALILLLISITNKVKHQAIAQELARRAERALAASRAAEPEPEPEPEPELATPVLRTGPDPDEIAQLQAQRAEANRRRREAWQRSLQQARDEHTRLREQAARAQAEVAAAEENLRRAREEARRLGSRLDSTKAARNALAQTEQNLAREQLQLVQQIAATRRNIDLAGRKQAAAPNEFALVPYDGTSGTRRHPIYIECTGKGFRFLPEGVFLGAEELDGFSESYNPLLVGAQTLLKYWNDRHLEDRRDQPEPYILLIVRPSGSFTYYVARKLLSSLPAGFGYELVEEDWAIASPRPDPGSHEVLHESVAMALDARQKVRASLAGVQRRGGYVYSKDQSANGMLVDPAKAAADGLRGGDPAPAPRGQVPRLAEGFADRREPGGRYAPDGARGSAGQEPYGGRDSIDSPGAAPGAVTLDERRLRTLENERTAYPPPPFGAERDANVDVNRLNARNASSGGSASISLPSHRHDDMPPELELPESSSTPADFTDVGKAARSPRNGVLEQKKRWGRARSRASIGLERKLDIVVQPHRIIVGTEQAVVPVTPAENSEKLVAAVAALIDQSADNWGLPPANFYWIPSIRFIVDPAAGPVHEQLRGGLKKLGLPTSTEYSSAAKGGAR
jgi:hypothetical protein